MNPTITSAARLVIVSVSVITVLVLAVVGALVATGTAPQDAVLVGALVVNGPVMGLLALLANTRPTEAMIGALQSGGDGQQTP